VEAVAGAAAATTAELASTFVAVTARGAKDSQIFYFPMRIRILPRFPAGPSEVPRNRQTRTKGLGQDIVQIALQ